MFKTTTTPSPGTETAPQETVSTPGETTPPAPEMPAAPETTPTTPAAEKKFLDEYTDENEAKAAIKQMKADITNAKKFIDDVAQYLEYDAQTGQAFLKEDKIPRRSQAGIPAEPTEPDPVEEKTRQVAKEVAESVRKQSETAEGFRGELTKEFKENDPFFDEHISEVDKAMKTLSLEQRANKHSWYTAYDLVRAKNIPKLIERAVKMAIEEVKKNTQAVQTTQVPPGGTTAGKPAGDSGTHGLSEEELRVCKKMNVAPADYAKQKSMRGK